MNAKLRHMLELPNEGIEVDNAGGMCPFQAEGRIDGFPFYFRSRGQEWTVFVCLDKNSPVDFCQWPEGAQQWAYREKYSNEPHEAGYITHTEAASFIGKGADILREAMRQ